ncbi:MULTISPECIES: ABC transporter ATP-binding protein [unclassified Pseudoalteromonas]|uniref:ABC transporter ATP-binding protein n=1 Tax=unclassified Pseudoalteromonas TaxID=194690 RepID=UPI000403E6D4|nr:MULTISPECIES: ABC transporter ATP-binding protein [unclassified Pseudoalteromonas]PCC14207.1 ABC transporter ATP-binding protein [Pseudoalteromonas sp. JB197]SJN16464.1 ABC transporter, ATP-binding protein [Pseudoalteromonas sp. JB197]
MRQPIIKMRNITKMYSTETMETYALKELDMEIAKGDYVSISGPSGCGKSTLLTIMGLLDAPSGGEYILDGQDVTELSLADAAQVRNKKIGFVFQQFNLIDELSVFENVALPLRYSDEQLSDDTIRARVEDSLKKVEMGHRINHKPNQLSGGQQQRIAIARALVTEPAILLVDEATGNLDSKNGELIMQLLDTLNQQGTTICMVTHDPRYADMAKTKLSLFDGQINFGTQNYEEIA